MKSISQCLKIIKKCLIFLAQNGGDFDAQFFSTKLTLQNETFRMIFKHYGRFSFVRLHVEKRRLDIEFHRKKKGYSKGRTVSIMTKKFRKAISNASLTTSIAKQDVSLFPPQVTMALKKL